MLLSERLELVAKLSLDDIPRHVLVVRPAFIGFYLSEFTEAHTSKRDTHVFAVYLTTGLDPLRCSVPGVDMQFVRPLGRCISDFET